MINIYNRNYEHSATALSSEKHTSDQSLSPDTFRAFRVSTSFSFFFVFVFLRDIMVDITNAETLIQGELDLLKKGGSFVMSNFKVIQAKLQPSVLMFKTRGEKRWSILNLKKVTGIQVEKENIFCLEIMENETLSSSSSPLKSPKRTLMRFRSNQTRKWIEYKMGQEEDLNGR